MKHNCSIYTSILAVAGALVLTACETVTPAAPKPPLAPSPERPTLSADALRVLTQIEEMQAEMRGLVDQVETMRNEMGNLRQRQRALYDDLDRRLRERERLASGAPAGSTPSAAGGGLAVVPPADLSPGTDGASAVLSEAPAAAQPGASDAAIAPSTSPENIGGSSAAATPEPTIAPAGTADEQTAYDQAFDLLKQSRYNEAITAFERFLATFPSGDLADDAQYWIAEARYVTRDFESALRGFRTVMGRYPDSQRVPDALLKIGYLQYEVGAFDEARKTLTDVMTRFPGTRVAVSADNRLTKMTQEGN